MSAQAAQLVRRAEECMGVFDVAGAVQALRAAVEADPGHTPALDALAAALLEAGGAGCETEAAALLERSAQAAPDENATKWMMLAQLSEGREAAARFRRGLAIMEARLAEARAAAAGAAGGGGGAEAVRALAREASTGLCSLAELYTTDLCFEPEAEAECERLLQMAVGTDATNPEAFHALVSLRLIQGRRDDAERYLERCVALLDEASAGGAASADGLELTMNVARAAFELGRYSDAAGLLEDALAQDASAVDAYYLLAFSYHRMQHRAVALEFLQQARGMLAREPDPELSAAAEELLADIQGSDYADRGAVPGGGGGGGGEEEEEGEEEEDVDGEMS